MVWILNKLFYIYYGDLQNFVYVVWDKYDIIGHAFRTGDIFIIDWYFHNVKYDNFKTLEKLINYLKDKTFDLKHLTYQKKSVKENMDQISASYEKKIQNILDIWYNTRPRPINRTKLEKLFDTKPFAFIEGTAPPQLLKKTLSSLNN